MAGFIPLHELIARRGIEGLGRGQKIVLESHSKAAELRAHCDELGKKWQQSSKFKAQVGKIEDEAERAARGALKEALRYYGEHGQTQRAYTELREFAERHWSPRLARQWDLRFTSALNDHIFHNRINPADLPNNFIEKMDAINKRIAMAGRLTQALRGIEDGQGRDAMLSRRDIEEARERAATFRAVEEYGKEKKRERQERQRPN